VLSVATEAAVKYFVRWPANTSCSFKIEKYEAMIGKKDEERNEMK
jgi:hypothetical protein